AEAVLSELARCGKRLGDAEVEHAHLAIRGDADVSRLDVAVNYAVIGVPVDGDGQVMVVFECLAKVSPDAGGKWYAERSAREHFRKVLPLDILHLDVEEPVELAVPEHVGDAGIGPTKMFLEARAAAFGFEDFLVLRTSSFVDKFEG